MSTHLFPYNATTPTQNYDPSIVENSASEKGKQEEMEVSTSENTEPSLNRSLNPTNSLLFKFLKDCLFLKNQIQLNDPISVVLMPVIESLIKDVENPINQKIRLIGCLIFLYENYPNALLVFCDTRINDLVSNPSYVLTIFLKRQMQVIDEANSVHSEADLRAIPPGKNHKLTDFLGDLILNSSGKINLGGIFLALDLVKYFFKDEQREQVKIVLNELISNQAFQAAVDATIAVHQCLENEIRISLKVPLNQPVTSRMAKKAVFKAIFSVLRQRENIGNCYAIATINLLTHDRPMDVYQLYVKFLSEGTASVGSFASDVSIETVMSTQRPQFSNFDKQIELNKILNFHSVQIVLSVLGYNYQTISIQSLGLEKKTSVLELFKHLALVDSMIRNNRGEHVNPEVFYHKAVDLLFSFKEDRLQWVLSCIIDFAVLNQKDNSLKHNFLQYLNPALENIFVTFIPNDINQNDAAEIYKYFIKKMSCSIWANFFSHSRISYSNQTLTVHSSPIDPPLKVIHAVEEESQKLITFLKREYFFIYKNEQSIIKLLKSNDYENMLKHMIVVVTDDLKRQYIDRQEDGKISILQRIVQFWNNQISLGFDLHFYGVIASVNKIKKFEATVNESMELEKKLGFCPLVMRGSDVSKVSKAMGLSIQSDEYLIVSAQHFLENLTKSIQNYRQKNSFSSNQLIHVQSYSLFGNSGSSGHSFVIRPSVFDFLLKDHFNLEKFINEKMILPTQTLLHQKVESNKLSIILFEAFLGILPNEKIENLHVILANRTVFQIHQFFVNRLPHLYEKLLNSFDMNLAKLSREDINKSFDQFFSKLAGTFNVNPVIKALLLTEINEGLVLYSHVELAAVISDILIQTNNVLVSTKNLEFFILNFFSLPAVINIADLNYSESVEDPVCEHLCIKASYRDCALHFYIHNGHVETFQSPEDERKYGRVVLSYLIN